MTENPLDRFVRTNVPPPIILDGRVQRLADAVIRLINEKRRCEGREPTRWGALLKSFPIPMAVLGELDIYVRVTNLIDSFSAQLDSLSVSLSTVLAGF